MVNKRKSLRERWSSHWIFLFAAIGCAVGLSSVWSFSYLAGKYGGGAFLIPYFLVLLLIGIPLLMLEYAIGQRMQRGAVSAFGRINPRLKGVGFNAVFVGFIFCAYYAVVMAWSLIYFFHSFRVSWAHAPRDFLFTKVLEVSSNIRFLDGINWIVFAALAAVWVVVYFCAWKGIRSISRVIIVTLPLSILLMLVLLIRGITLPGSLEGILFYITPDFRALLDIAVWNAAISQVFFTLSIAFGVMISYASFSNKTNIRRDAWITAAAVFLFSVMIGFVVFSALGFMAAKQGLPVSEVAAAGHSLIFVAYPNALSMMPFAALLSLVFFLAVLSLAVNSMFSIVAGISTVISDRFRKISKQWIAGIICFAGFLAGIIFTTRAGMYFMDLFDHFAMNYGLVLVGIAQCIAVGWIFGADRLRRYINKDIGWKLGKRFDFSVKYLCPILLGYLVIAKLTVDVRNNYGGYPGWAMWIGLAVVLVPILISILFSLLPSKR